MLNEWKEFLDYTGPVAYTYIIPLSGAINKDVDALGQFVSK